MKEKKKLLKIQKSGNAHVSEGPCLRERRKDFVERGQPVVFPLSDFGDTNRFQVQHRDHDSYPLKNDVSSLSGVCVINNFSLVTKARHKSI